MVLFIALCHYICRSTSSDDNLEIKWCRGSSDFVMTVDLVKITSMDVLVEKLKACIWEEDKTKAFSKYWHTYVCSMPS